MGTQSCMRSPQVMRWYDGIRLGGSGGDTSPKRQRGTDQKPAMGSPHWMRRSLALGASNLADFPKPSLPRHRGARA
jgi:hypothetical protein